MLQILQDFKNMPVHIKEKKNLWVDSPVCSTTHMKLNLHVAAEHNNVIVNSEDKPIK